MKWLLNALLPLLTLSTQPLLANELATFAGGCFWCVEEAFDKVPGVITTTSGFANGRMLRARQQEVFVAIFLDAQHRVVATEELFQGTLTQTSVYPREIVKRALHHNAAAAIFAHNHPSGVAEPSDSDRLVTEALKQVLQLVDIRVLDHFIVAGADCLSFAEKDML